MRINVICGGTSDEREVSLRSGAAVVNALDESGHDVTVLDTDVDDSALADCDVVFPVLHGAGGEDGTIQERFESLGLRYVGSGPEACALTFDKQAFKQRLAEAGILTPRGTLLRADELRTHELTQRPFVLKPIDGGSSIDTFIVRDPATAPWDEMMRALSETHEQMLLEELIEGTELTVGILEASALPVIEIIPPQDGEFDYENKYNGQTQELCPPEHVDEITQQAVQRLAEQAHTLAGCRDMSRTDFITTTDGAHYLLETNTIPGMTDQSLYPKMAATAGITFPELVDQLVQLAASR